LPTFKKKPEIVDGRQFTGGIRNGTDLIFWVNSKEGKADWFEETLKVRTATQKIMSPERIRVYKGPYQTEYDTAYVGDWIVQRQSGRFEVVRPQELAEDYDKA
jgi:hypothetical protein